MSRGVGTSSNDTDARWTIAGVWCSIALIAIGIMVYRWQQQQIFARVTAQNARITLDRDKGDNRTIVPRQVNGEIFYRVTLSDTPVGKKLPLSCNWIAPDGQIVHQNRYRTRPIKTPVWNTFCRHIIGSASPVGRWNVQMFLGDRALSNTQFDVQ